MYQRFGKRFFDIVLSGIGLVMLSPAFVIIACLIKTKLGHPVIFSQSRLGKHEKNFKMYKFRSMADIKDENGKLLPDEERLTEFGRKLRDTSLDELPELLNILKGDMSIVGPRPLLVEYLPLYNERQKRRHEVRPGLTGLAQVNGRNTISWEEKFELDIRYVDNMSFLEDVKIVFQTMDTVLRRKGIHSETSVTMEKFKGE